jgi:hypothetical protein
MVEPRYGGIPRHPVLPLKIHHKIRESNQSDSRPARILHGIRQSGKTLDSNGQTGFIFDRRAA